MIMKETLDNEEQIFMEGAYAQLFVALNANDYISVVPTLTPPNMHPLNDMHLPVALLDLTVQTGDHENQGVQQTVEKITQPVHRFLKKVKGMKSLALSLSWMLVLMFRRGNMLMTLSDLLQSIRNCHLRRSLLVLRKSLMKLNWLAK